MSSNQDDLAIKDALNRLVVDKEGDLHKLDSLLGEFNVFRVLGIEHMEILHSNMLAWLFNPDESHGLHDLFLRRYLMQVFHVARSETEYDVENEQNIDILEPASIDVAEYKSVEVLREWQGIDILINMSTSEGNWLIVIENKVNAKQGKDQLERYRKIAIEHYPKHKHYYFLLSKNEEKPEDDYYINTRYELIHIALKACLERRSNSIATEPYALIRNYLNLLEQKFMENSEIAALAQKIYKQHKLAIDTIMENILDAKSTFSEYLQDNIKLNKDLIPMPSSKIYARFIPKSWNTPSNRKGDAWGKEGAFIMIEIHITISKDDIMYQIIIVRGKAPYDWVLELYEKTQKPRFKKSETSKLPDETIYNQGKHFVHYDKSVKYKIPLGEYTDNPENANKEAWDNIIKYLNKDSYKKKLNFIQEHIIKLP